MSTRSEKLARIAFNAIHKVIKNDEEPMDGDETEDTCKALLVRLDEYEAND